MISPARELRALFGGSFGGGGGGTVGAGLGAGAAAGAGVGSDDMRRSKPHLFPERIRAARRGWTTGNACGVTGSRWEAGAVPPL